MSGSIKWDIHLRAIAIRQGLNAPPASAICCMCGATVTLRHYTRECPLLDFFRIAIHTQLALAISDFVPRWSVNRVTLPGILIFYGNSLFGITVGPAALAGPLAYPCANLGFTGEVTPADEKLLLSRGITRSALRHTLGFVLRTVVTIHSRHRLPAVPSLPDHHAHISGNEHFFLSWIEPSPEEHLPSSWSFSAPRAIQWPHPAILRWVVTVFAMSLSVPHFNTGGGDHPMSSYTVLIVVFRYSPAGSHPTPVLCPGPRVHFRSSPPGSPPLLSSWSRGLVYGVRISESASQFMAGYQAACWSPASGAPACYAASSFPGGCPTSA